MSSKFERLAKDTIVFALGSVGSKAILFLLVPLYTNCLTAEEFGAGELILTYGQLLLPIVSCMFYDAVLRFGASIHETREDVALAGTIACGLSAALSTALLPVFWMVPSVGRWGILLSAYLSISSFYQLCINYLKAKGRNAAFAVAGIVATAITALTAILFVAVLRWGVGGYVLSSVIGVTGGALVALTRSSILADCRRGAFDRGLWKRMFAYSAPLVFTNVAWWVVNSSDRLMVEAMVGQSALGLYAAAAKIPSLINVIVAVFSQAWGLSSIREVEGDGDTKFSSDVFRFYSAVTFGAAMGAIAVVKPFMGVYVGPDFQSAWSYTPLLLSAAVFYALATYYASLYSAIKRTVNGMVTTMVCALVNVVINYFGIAAFGTWGAVLGTVCAYALLLVVRMVDVGRYLEISVDIRKLAVNSLNLLAFAVLVTVEWHALGVSVLCLSLYLVVNRTELAEIVGKVRSLVRRLHPSR